jgi:TfoX/Sxy family transcriptional regulator of competence genes
MGDMASQQSTVDFIIDQIGSAGAVSAKKMFGEYGIYCNGKMVALVCDDQLYIKPTAPGRSYLGDVTEQAPYPSAKPCFLIPGEKWDQGDWLTELIRLSTAALPQPTKKRKAK